MLAVPQPLPELIESVLSSLPPAQRAVVEISMLDTYPRVRVLCPMCDRIHLYATKGGCDAFKTTLADGQQRIKEILKARGVVSVDDVMTAG
jgi:hypothetical protein